MKTLYIVATPIGNLADISQRALNILSEVDFVVAEDTRHANILFKKYNLNPRTISFHARSTGEQAREILSKLGPTESVAYISDAGTPGISDPGYLLVHEAIKQNIKIVPIPGPSALITFLSAAGLPTNSFIFRGFLPHKKGRQTFLMEIKYIEQTVVFYESVHRFSRLLAELEEILEPERKIVIGRELTKIYEEFFRGTVREAQQFFSKDKIKGEFVVGIAPRNFSFLDTTNSESNLSTELVELRQKIDQLDFELLKLLNKRLKISRKIAKVKEKQGLPQYIPKRENHLIKNLQILNKGKLKNSDIKQIWAIILEISRGKFN